MNKFIRMQNVSKQQREISVFEHQHSGAIATRRAIINFSIGLQGEYRCAQYLYGNGILHTAKLQI